jgi:hypothetical protein
MKIFSRRTNLQATFVLIVTFSQIVLAERIGADTGKGSAEIQSPKNLVFQNGTCWLLNDGSYMGKWTSKKGSEFSFSIGPTTGTIAQFFSYKKNPIKYQGPGKYVDIYMILISADYDLNTWTSTVTVNADGKTGHFDDDNGSIIGTWTCGGSPKRLNKSKK